MSGLIGFDTETHLIVRGRKFPRLVVATTSTEVLDRESALVWWLNNLGKRPIVCHNAAFDAGVMAARAYEEGHNLIPRTFAALESGMLRCTLIRAKLLAIAEGSLKRPRGFFSLAGQVAHYFGRDITEAKKDYTPCGCGSGCPKCGWFGFVGPWRKRYHQLDGLAAHQWPDEAWEYASMDAVWASRVFDAQTEAGNNLATQHGYFDFPDETEQAANDFALALIAARGVHVDPERTATLAAEIEEVKTRALEIGTRAGFLRGPQGVAAADPTLTKGKPGTRSQAAMAALVQRQYGGLAPLTEKGAVKSDRDTLLRSGDEDLVAYAELGQQLTIAKTYLPTLVAGATMGGGPITSDANCLVATGRVSWRRPNWTNPPREGGFRECVVPRPGYVFVAADYSAVEFRALGQICLWEGYGDKIANSFREGIDPHLDFAASMLGVSYEEALERHNAGDSLVSARRQLAKVANYGFPGGLGAERFVAHCRSQGVTIDMEMSWSLRNQFRQHWPEMGPYFDSVAALTDNGAKFDQKAYVSGRIRGGVGYCDGCNGRFQSLVADGAKLGARNLVKAAHEGSLFGGFPVLFLHDENIVEAPEDKVHEVADRLVGIMKDAMRRFIPDVPVEVEAAAMRRWEKGAKPKYDENGRLVPW